jgi:hypothetical protein
MFRMNWSLAAILAPATLGLLSFVCRRQDAEEPAMFRMNDLLVVHIRHYAMIKKLVRG